MAPKASESVKSVLPQKTQNCYFLTQSLLEGGGAQESKGCMNGSTSHTQALSGTFMPPHHPEDTAEYVELPSLAPDGAKSSVVQATFNGVNVLAGVGILSTPYALSEGGWGSLLILFALAVVCWWTGTMLRECMEARPGVRSYPDIGAAAFGGWGHFLVCLLLYLELYLVTVEFLILEGDNLSGMFPHLTLHLGPWTLGAKPAFIIISTLIVLPTMHIKELSLLSYISALGVASTATVVGAVLWLNLVNHVGPATTPSHSRAALAPPAPGQHLIRWQGVAMAAGLFGFCYSAHAVFPSIYSSMKEPSRFPQVLGMSFTFCTVLYATIAVVGYRMFGQDLMSQITLNLPPHLAASQLAIWMTIVIPFAKYAITLSPVAAVMEESLLGGGQCGGYSKSRFTLRTVLVVSTAVVALSVPFFGLVMAFIGAFLSVTMSVVMPCACYIQMFGRRMSRVHLLACWGVMVIGALMALAGTYASLSRIMLGLQELYAES